MARPRKENLEYFPFDADFFRDKKISRLKATFGSDGIAVYLYMLCEIYHNGYYIEYDEDLVLDISDYFSYSTEKTTQILNYLFSRSLLVMIESKLAEPVKVISAQSVQRRYQEAKKGAKRDIAVEGRLWLLSSDETLSFIKLCPEGSFSEKNGGYSEKNGSYSGKNHTKESKEKERKEKEIKGKESKEDGGGGSRYLIPCRNGRFEITDEHLAELTHTYPDMDVEKVLMKIRDYLNSHPDKMGYTSGARSYIELWMREDNDQGKYRRQKYSGTYDLSFYENQSVIDDMEDENSDNAQ